MLNKKKIYFANDHAGYEQKQAIIDYLNQKGYEVVDLGPNQEQGSVDYVPYAIDVASKVVDENKNSENDDALGVLVCGTGIGMSIAASKVSGSRSALVYNQNTAKLAKQHNNANVISIGVRENSIDEVKKMLDSFLESEFLGERHQRRVDLITKYENQKKS